MDLYQSYLPPRKKRRAEPLLSFTSLHAAVLDGNVCILDQLLRLGADINQKNNNGFTPLHVAVLERKNDCFNLLLNREADVEIRDRQLKLPLHCAAQNGDVLMLKRLLTFKSTINAQDGRKYSPLHVAIEYKKFHCLEDILNAGANVYIRDCYGRTPLQMAVDKGYSIIVDRLLAMEDDVQGLNGLHTLNDAILTKNLDYVEHLLNAGVDMDVADSIDLSPLNNAVINGNRFIWKKLLDKKPKALRDKRWRFKLFESVLSMDKLDYFNDLIEAGVNVHIKNAHGTTLLHLAAKSKEELPLMKLLELNLDVDAQDHIGQTPLHLACITQRLNNVILLLDYGARWDIQNNSKQTMLWHFLRCMKFSDLFDDEIPLVKAILERTNDGLPINHFTKRTAAHIVIDLKFWKQSDPTFQLTKLVLSTQKTLNVNDHKSISVVNYITKNLNCLGMNVIPLICICIERGACLDCQDCERIKKYPRVRNSLLRDVQFCTQSIENRFKNLSIKKLRTTPILQSCIIIEQNVRAAIGRNGYCDISQLVIMLLSG